MVELNHRERTIKVKVVYYGPAVGGKTTNLQVLHQHAGAARRGELVSINSAQDRTILFDLLPLKAAGFRGFDLRLQLAAVPGQAMYAATRRMVLKGADCVVFVADSQEPVLDANLDALANLKENLEANEIDPGEIPTVLQYNKRDLPNALPVEILNERLNPRGLPFFEAVAMKGQGVDETLKAATGLVFKSLATKYGGGGSEAAKAATSTPTTAPVRPAAAAPPAAPRPAAPPMAARAAVATPAPARVAAPAPAPARAAVSTDELLESIDLTDDSSELSLGESEMETVASEELSLDPPSPPSSPSIGRTTLIRSANEADDLRARIGRTTDPELTLDAGDPDDEDIEEISFDTAPNLVPESEPAPAPAPRAAAVPPRVAPPVAPAPRPPVAAAPPAAPRTLPPTRAPGGPAAASASVTIPPVAAASGRVGENTAPVRVSATVQSGDKQVALPVEITVKNGQGQVEIHLKILIDLKGLG